MSIHRDMLNKVRTQGGFIAALDQSGGSTPTALKAYGVNEDAYSDDESMYALVHAMRTRIVTSSVFNGKRILGAILFENTLDREIQGLRSSEFLWQKKNVVPFLKVDKGLADVADGVQIMKPIPNLSELLDKANACDTFGTKMRSVIKSVDAGGMARLIDQQFEIAREICAAGLVPIIEPEVDIHAADKRDAESMLAEEILPRLDALNDDQTVMLKLTLPDEPGLYDRHVAHARVARVVALSGGYSREEANRRLAENHGVIASFSRALSEGLSSQLADEEFDRTLDTSIEAIYQASCT